MLHQTTATRGSRADPSHPSLLDRVSWCSVSLQRMAPPTTDSPLDLSHWCQLEHLTGDASARSYSRLWRPPGETAILVEYPAGVRHQVVRDLEVSAWCHERGLLVPRVLAVTPADGRVLLEDMGDRDGETALTVTTHDLQPGLLDGMLRPLELLAGCDPAALPPWNPPLDRARLRWELAGFELWFVSHLKNTRPWESLDRWLNDLSEEVAGHPRRVCHRDYHLNNLLVQDDGEVAVLDIQDILVGPDTYDAVSLLTERAAIRLIPDGERRRLMARWADRTAARPGWQDRAMVVQVQRGLKVLGTFARLSLEGRSGYRAWMAELAANLVGLLETLGADHQTTALLID